MAVGYCCHPLCKIKRRAEHCIVTGETMDIDDEFVVVECTHANKTGCGQKMHMSCYMQIEALGVQVIKSKMRSATLNEGEILKSMWDKTRSGKYDIIYRSTITDCICGGKLCACQTSCRRRVDTASHVSQTVKHKKNKNKEVVKYQGKINLPDTLDEDQRMYIYKREECDETNCPIATHDDYMEDINCEFNYPSLPPKLFPDEKKNIYVAYSSKPMPEIKSCILGDSHIVTVENTRSGEWIRRVIGKNGERLKRIDMQFGTKTTIREDRKITITIQNTTIPCTKGNLLSREQRRETRVAELIESINRFLM